MSILWQHRPSGSSPLSALLRQPGGVQVRHGACLDLKHLSLDVVAGELLAGLADGDGLAALVADVDGLAVFLPAHGALRALLSVGQLLDRLVQHLQLVQGPLRYLKGLRGTVVRLQVLHGLFAQSDELHVLRLVRHLALQHADSLDLRAGVHHAALRDQSRHALHVSCRLGEEGESGVGRFCRLPLCGDDADLLVLSRHKVDVLHVSRHHQLDLLLRAGGQLVLLLLQDVTHLLGRSCHHL